MMRDAQAVTDAIPLEVTGSLNHPETGERLFFERGKMLATVTDGAERDFLALTALPKELLGAGSPFTVHAVVVNQEPAVPVNPGFSDFGGCLLNMKPEAYTREQEINAGYQVLAKAAVGPVEYALAENPKTHFFATWERTPANDKGGEPNYYWGHYTEDRDKALADFSSRVREKCAELAEDRKPSIRKLLAAKPPERPVSAAKARVQEAAL